MFGIQYSGVVLWGQRTATGRHLPCVAHCGNAFLYHPSQRRDLHPWARETTNSTSVLSSPSQGWEVQKRQKAEKLLLLWLFFGYSDFHFESTKQHMHITQQFGIKQNALGLPSPQSLSASSIMCQPDTAPKLISSHRFSENTDTQLSDPRMVHILSAASCLVDILTCLEPAWAS